MCWPTTEPARPQIADGDYGSIRGDESSDSDIDLMVVGSVSPSELSLPLPRARICSAAISIRRSTPGRIQEKRAAKTRS